MSVSLQTLTSYTPALVQRCYTKHQLQSLSPKAERQQAAVLYIDIVGLTGLAELLSHDYALSASDTLSILNVYLTELLDLIHSHGGEVFQFSGDSLVVLWPVGVIGKNLTTVTRRAAACSLALQAWEPEKYSEKVIHKALPAELHCSLHMKIVLDAGDIWVATIGGLEGHWECVLAGHALEDIEDAYSVCDPEQVICSPSAQQLLQKYARGTEKEAGLMSLESLQHPLKPRTVSPVDVNPDAAQLLRSYISPIVLDQLETNDGHWLAAYCDVTVLVASIDGIDYRTDTVLEQLQDALFDIQQVINYFSGQLIQFIIDTSGTHLIAAWGLPQHDYPDKAIRCVHAAQKINIVLHELGLQACIGVSSGSVLCGIRGNYIRRHFDLIGGVLHSADALRSMAHNTIYCDSATFLLTNNSIDYDELSNDHPLITDHKIYHPFEQKQSVYSTEYTLNMVGRRTERQQLLQYLERLNQNNMGKPAETIIIDGEAGIGKSYLVRDFVHQSMLYGCQHYIIYGHYNQRYMPFYFWRVLLKKLLFQYHKIISPHLSPSEKRHALLQYLRRIPHLKIYLPLLSYVLPIQRVESSFSKQLYGKVRLAHICKAIIILLQHILYKNNQPLIWIFENAHYMDSASWHVLQQVQKRLPMILYVLVTEPLANRHPQLEHILKQRQHTKFISLTPLNDTEIYTLVCQHLNVVDLPNPVQVLLKKYSQGSPLLSEELLYQLRDKQYIQITDGICRVTTAVDNLENFSFSSSPHEAIKARLQLLSTKQRYLCHFASCFGIHFRYPMLQALYPDKIQRAYLLSLLEILKSLNLLEFDIATPDLTFTFKHDIIQYQAQHSLCQDQAPRTHTLIAQWYEDYYAKEIPLYYSVLAYHWEKANVPEKSISYLENAGEQALSTYANKEAIVFFTQALDVDKQQSDSVPAVQRAGWLLKIGQAYLNLKKLRKSEQFLIDSLQLLKRPFPRSKIMLGLRLTGQVIQQGLHRLVPKFFVGRYYTQATPLLHAAEAYALLGNIMSQQQRKSWTLYSHLANLNLAESASSHSPHLACSYAHAMLYADSIKLPRLSKHYANHAARLQNRITDKVAKQTVYLIMGRRCIGLGDWQGAHDNIAEGLQISKELSDMQGQIHAHYLLSLLYQCKNEFKFEIAEARLIYEWGLEYDDLKTQVRGLCAQSVGFLRLGDTSTAVACLKIVQALPSECIDLTEAIRVCSLLSQVYMRQDNVQQALEMALKTSHLLDEMELPSIELFEAYSSIIEVYLHLWETHYQPTTNIMERVLNTTVFSSKERFAFAKLSERICDMFDKYAEIYPVAAARSWGFYGLYHWVDGDVQLAQRCWQRAIECAEKYQLPYEQGLAHFEMARHLPQSHPQTSQHIQYAYSLFKQVNAKHELDKLNKMFNLPT